MNLICTNTAKLLWVVLLIGGFTVVAEAQITSWSSTTAIPENRQYPASAIWNGRIYVTGGDLNADFTGTNTVYRATLNADGSISSWATSTMPVYKAAHACVAWNGYLYVMGGYNDWGFHTSSVRYAPINPDGSLGSWAVAPDMPAVRIGLSAAVWNGRIYAVGGASGIVITARNSLYIGTIAGDGSITSWSSTTIPVTRAFHATVAANGYLYVIGGGTGDWADDNATNTVYFAIINADGSLGSWSTTTALPADRNRHSAFFNVALNQLYVMGGRDGDGVTRSEVWYAPVNANGTLGNWVSTTSLPAARKDFATAVNSADNRAYVVGGTNAQNATVNTVWYTSATISIREDKLTNMPAGFALYQNYPNPFNSIAVISYQLPVACFVDLTVYDILGREVATLVNGRKEAGRYEVQFNASHLSSGVYFYKLQAGSFTSVKKLLLMK